MRELTKVHEEVVRGTAAELAERYADAPPRGEVVLVVGAAGGGRLAATRRDEAVAAVARLVEAGAKRAGGGRRGRRADGRERERAVPGGGERVERERTVTDVTDRNAV